MLPPPTLLLTTKLYRPPTAPNGVVRPALLARLQAGLTRKLTLISAPPGFGKTTLVSQWLDNFRLPLAASGSNQPAPAELQELKFCWLSLDEGDNNLAQFLRYLIAALRTCAPEACPTTQSLLATVALPNVDYLADVLVSELTMLAPELVLVLDDYHRIRSGEVHTILRHLLRYLPPALHLIILTRTDPPLDLGRLRIEGQISELRAKDLSFALEETRHFFQQRISQPLNNDALQTLQARTEGWVTGLQLASLSLQSEEPSQFLAHFRGSDRLLVGYLMEEVMARLPETMQAFLVRTAIVDRFCAALGDALLAASPIPVSSQAAIAQLEEQNLFLIPLDEEGTWYRYHDLFRDFLRHHLKHKWMPIDLAHLHQRASVWLAGAGLIEDALRHALAGGEDHFAADLVETQFHPLLNQQVPMYTLTRWLALFAEATIQTHPGLLIAQASQAAFGMGPDLSLRRFAQIETLLDQDNTLPPERRQSLEADLNLLRGIFAYTTGELQAAIPYLRCALASLPPAHEFARAVATLHLAFVYASKGEGAEGRTLLATAMTEAMAEQRPTQIVLLNALALLQFYAADLIAATHTTARIFATVQTKRLSWQGVGLVDVWLGRADYFQGVIAYEQNNLAAASQHWRQVEALRYRTNPHLYHDSLVGQALVAQARGAAADALAYAQAALEFAAETRSPVLQANSEALEARLALLAHDLLFVWDDDDIYLPHRLRFSVERFDMEKGFFKPEHAWLWKQGALSGPLGNLFHVGSCWSRQRFDSVRGYPAEGTGYDLIFEARLAKHLRGATKPYKIKPEEIYYIYRWGGTGSYHMSGFGHYKPGGNVGHDNVAAFVQQRASRGEIGQGDIALQPHWKTDYRQLVSSYLTTLAEQQAQDASP